MKEIQDYINGRKSYILMTLGMLTSLTLFLAGDMSLGEFVSSDSFNLLITSLGIGTIKHAVSKK